jgi:hypothetical protein
MLHDWQGITCSQLNSMLTSPVLADSCPAVIRSRATLSGRYCRKRPLRLRQQQQQQGRGQLLCKQTCLPA